MNKIALKNKPYGNYKFCTCNSTETLFRKKKKKKENEKDENHECVWVQILQSSMAKST